MVGTFVMTDSEILECSETVYKFLVWDNDISKNGYGKTFEGSYNYTKVIKVIQKYNMGDIISFTRFLNKKYRILPDPLWTGNASEFFSTVGQDFYKTIIRDIKLRQLVN